MEPMATLALEHEGETHKVEVHQHGVRFTVSCDVPLNGTWHDDHLVTGQGVCVWTFLDASAAMAFALDRCGWPTDANELERAESQRDNARP